jgi:hypothetical protein
VSVVVLVLLVSSVVAAIGLHAAMFVLDRPYYGMLGIGVLLGPSTILTFVHVAMA